MADELTDPPEDVAIPAMRQLMTHRQRVTSVLVGLGASAAGVAAVFLTANELGTATLLAAGVYFVLASLLGWFPKLKFGDNEIDPSEVAEARKESSEAKSDSGDAKEGLAEVLERLNKLEATAGRREDASARRPEDETIPGRQEPLPPRPPAARADDGLDPRLAQLAKQYNEVRWTMPSGGERTAIMTGIVTSMIELCQRVGVPDVDGLLTGEDRGRRLLAVAFLNARPDASRIPQLVLASVQEDKPFNEYWALQTLRKTLRGNCGQLVPDLRLKLQARMNALPRGTDRWRLIQAILSDCP